MSGNKYRGNCEEVIRKFGGGVRGVVRRTVNHEFDPKFCKDGFHEVDGESTQSVSVHDHNFFDISIDCGVQNGRKAFAFEVKAAPNV